MNKEKMGKFLRQLRKEKKEANEDKEEQIINEDKNIEKKSLKLKNNIRYQ